MSEVPTAVSESTATEIVRKEGSTRSWKSIDTITAGDLLTFPNNSGVRQGIAGSVIVGAALYDAVSGARVVTIQGKVRARWDGAGTVNAGTVIGSSATRSGWFEPSAVTSGTLVIGYSINNLGASNSGVLNPVELFA